MHFLNANFSDFGCFCYLLLHTGIIWPGSFPLLFYIEYCEKTLKSAQTLPAIDSIATTSTTVPMAVSKLPWQENATPDHSLLSNRFFLQNNATLANFEGANVLELGAGTGTTAPPRARLHSDSKQKACVA